MHDDRKCASCGLYGQQACPHHDAAKWWPARSCYVPPLLMVENKEAALQALANERAEFGDREELARVKFALACECPRTCHDWEEGRDDVCSKTKATARHCNIAVALGWEHCPEWAPTPAEDAFGTLRYAIGRLRQHDFDLAWRADKALALLRRRDDARDCVGGAE